MASDPAYSRHALQVATQLSSKPAARRPPRALLGAGSAKPRPLRPASGATAASLLGRVPHEATSMLMMRSSMSSVSRSLAGTAGAGASQCKATTDAPKRHVFLRRRSGLRTAGATAIAVSRPSYAAMPDASRHAPAPAGSRLPLPRQPALSAPGLPRGVCGSPSSFQLHRRKPLVASDKDCRELPTITTGAAVRLHPPHASGAE